jgi:iron-sulfur cluster repair protein YtfE (RIC family)
MDPVLQLAHDHKHLTRLLLDLTALVRELRDGTLDMDRAHAPLVDAVTALRDDLFEHFAREEGALFPALRRMVPDLTDRVARLEEAHDGVCGSVARMLHAVNRADVETLLGIFERFEGTYSAHARDEADLLEQVGRRLTPAQRAEIAELIEGL